MGLNFLCSSMNKIKDIPVDSDPMDFLDNFSSEFGAVKNFFEDLPYCSNQRTEERNIIEDFLKELNESANSLFNFLVKDISFDNPFTFPNFPDFTWTNDWALPDIVLPSISKGFKDFFQIDIKMFDLDLDFDIFKSAIEFDPCNISWFQKNSGKSYYKEADKSYPNFFNKDTVSKVLGQYNLSKQQLLKTLLHHFPTLTITESDLVLPDNFNNIKKDTDISTLNWEGITVKDVLPNLTFRDFYLMYPTQDYGTLLDYLYPNFDFSMMNSTFDLTYDFGLNFENLNSMNFKTFLSTYIDFPIQELERVLPMFNFLAATRRNQLPFFFTELGFPIPISEIRGFDKNHTTGGWRYKNGEWLFDNNGGWSFDKKLEDVDLNFPSDWTDFEKENLPWEWKGNATVFSTPSSLEEVVKKIGYPPKSTESSESNPECCIPKLSSLTSSMDIPSIDPSLITDVIDINGFQGIKDIDISGLPDFSSYMTKLSTIDPKGLIDNFGLDSLDSVSRDSMFSNFPSIVALIDSDSLSYSDLLSSLSQPVGEFPKLKIDGLLNDFKLERYNLKNLIKQNEIENELFKCLEKLKSKLSVDFSSMSELNKFIDDLFETSLGQGALGSLDCSKVNVADFGVGGNGSVSGKLSNLVNALDLCESLIRGGNNNIYDLARNLGIDINSLKDSELRKLAELASRKNETSKIISNGATSNGGISNNNNTSNNITSNNTALNNIISNNTISNTPKLKNIITNNEHPWNVAGLGGGGSGSNLRHLNLNTVAGNLNSNQIDTLFTTSMKNNSRAIEYIPQTLQDLEKLNGVGSSGLSETQYDDIVYNATLEAVSTTSDPKILTSIKPELVVECKRIFCGHI